MSSGTYTPHPGTLPDKALQYLRTLPPGTWVSTAVINEAIGQDPTYQLSAALSRARYTGLVTCRRAKNAPFFEWTLGDGTPPEEAQLSDDTDDEDRSDGNRPAPVFPSQEALQAANPWRPVPAPAPATRPTVESVQIVVDGVEVAARVAGDMVTLSLRGLTVSGVFRKTLSRNEAVMVSQALAMVFNTPPTGAAA